jgi:hypothetical protein
MKAAVCVFKNEKKKYLFSKNKVDKPTLMVVGNEGCGTN